MDLKKRILKDIFRECRVAQVAGEVTIKFVFVAVNKRVEIFGGPLVAIPGHQLLVRLRDWSCVIRGRGVGCSRHHYAPPRPRVHGRRKKKWKDRRVKGRFVTNSNTLNH